MDWPFPDSSMVQGKDQELLVRRLTPKNSSARGSWSPRVVIRPEPEREGSIECANANELKRFRLNRHLALQLLARDQHNGASIPEEIEEVLKLGGLWGDGQTVTDDAALKHWHDRNWDAAIDYFLWSRRSDFVDGQPEYVNVQEEVIATYAKEAPLPIAEHEPLPTTVALPTAQPLPMDQLGDVLFRRANARFIPSISLSVQCLSDFLTYGLAEAREARQVPQPENLRSVLRSFGSAFDYYLALYNIDGLHEGIYRYEPLRHDLTPIRTGQFREDVQACLIGQPPPLTAAATLFIVAEFRRYQWRYRHERALRNIYIEAGHLMQQLLVVATAYRLRTIITPAVADSLAIALLQLDRVEHQVLYTLTLGGPGHGNERDHS